MDSWFHTSIRKGTRKLTNWPLMIYRSLRITMAHYSGFYFAFVGRDKACKPFYYFSLVCALFLSVFSFIVIFFSEYFNEIYLGPIVSCALVVCLRVVFS